jgi:hypothetical protein
MAPRYANRGVIIKPASFAALKIIAESGKCIAFEQPAADQSAGTRA